MEFCQLGDLAIFTRKRDKLDAHPVTADMMTRYPNPPGAGFHEVVVRHFSKQLASALEFLRSKDFVHRDLKPQNLLLNPPPAWLANEPLDKRPYEVHKDLAIPLAGLESLPTLKIADFGFARHLPTATMAETLCGSPLYMAPEILRYERYDAKADLWSVGTVLYELVAGKPPFRAANHVDLLRKIERTNDVITFPRECDVSDVVKVVIRALLKKQPTNRMSWEAFFNSAMNTDEIPGLHPSDRPKQWARAPSNVETGQQEPSVQQKTSSRALKSDSRSSSGTKIAAIPSSDHLSPQQTVTQRPALASHATAPAAQALKPSPPRQQSQTEKRLSAAGNSPIPSLPRETAEERSARRKRETALALTRERAAQDIAFERDYVMVEKRAVEVNAFADELEASPQVLGGTGTRYATTAPSPGALMRRATTQGRPNSITGAQQEHPRSMQVAVRPEQFQARRQSWDQKAVQARQSAASVLAKAINAFHEKAGPMFGDYFGPQTPPSQAYGAFPAFPATYALPQGLTTDISRVGNLTDDQKMLVLIEECAQRSDVVYSFAEVKYKQLIPITPSRDNALGPRKNQEGPTDDNDDLTMDAVVEISEEALVLYVKALTILTNTFNAAGRWWTKTHRADTHSDASNFSRSMDSERTRPGSPSMSVRVNAVVQWARGRYNECLQKSEYVTCRLADAQKKLPRSHPGHPSNHGSELESVTTPGVASTVHLSSGVTAEKLMYERAVEMSKTAALNELTHEDLPGCEVSYLTAVRLLEAVLETEEDATPGKAGTMKQVKDVAEADDLPAADDMEEADRKTVETRKYCNVCREVCVLMILQSSRVRSLDSSTYAKNLQAATLLLRSVFRVESRTAEKLKQQQEHHQRPRDLWLADEMDNVGLAIRIGMVYTAMHWGGFLF